MRKSIKKSETVKEDETFELTNIKVKEVSLVDRAANQRKFLVTKKDKKTSKGTGDAITVEDAQLAAQKAQESQAGTPAAELDRLDAERAAAAPVAAEGSPVVAEPVVEAVKSDVTVEIIETSNGVVVDVTGGNSFSEGTAEQALQTKVKIAWQGAIDAVRARLEVMSEQVNSPDFYPWSYIEYIKCMLDSMYEIGGPEWEIEVAATNAAKAKGEDVSKRQAALTKIGRAISGARMRSLKEMHGKLSDVQKMFDSLMAEVEAEPETEKVATKTETAPVAEVAPVAEPVAAPVPVVVPAPVAATIDITQVPAFKALQDSVAAQNTELERLRNIAKEQDEQLAKARATVRSNALTQETRSNHNDVVWDRDMASPSSRLNSRTRRF